MLGPKVLVLNLFISDLWLTHARKNSKLVGIIECERTFRSEKAKKVKRIKLERE